VKCGSFLILKRIEYQDDELVSGKTMI